MSKFRQILIRCTEIQYANDQSYPRNTSGFKTSLNRSTSLPKKCRVTLVSNTKCDICQIARTNLIGKYCKTANTAICNKTIRLKYEGY